MVHAQTTIDLTAEENEDNACLFIEKYHLLEGCDSGSITGGNCSLNYTRRANEDDSIFESNWIQSKIVSIEQTPNCINLNTGIFSETDYNNQAVVTLSGEDGQPNAYFVFNIAADTAKAAYNITSVEDLVKSGPMNFPEAKFGKGFVNYEVSGSSVLVYLSMDLIGLDGGVSLTTGVCPNLDIGENPFVMRNCLDAGIGFNTDDLFLSVFKYTPGLWTYAIQMLLFFIFTLSAQQDVPINQKYKDNATTYHSWVSVRNTGYAAFTKTSRYTQIFLSTAIWGFVHTIYLQMEHPSPEDDPEYNIVSLTVIPTVIGLVLSTIVTHITGSILMNIAKIHREYAYAYKNCTSMDQKVQLEDKYEGQKANRYFAFYVLAFIIFQILCWETIWQQEYFSSDFKLYFFINFAVSCIAEWLVIDWIRAIIGSGDGSGLGACLKRRGFWYDYSLQDLFEQIEEDD